ncbi:hypothetical protein GOZ89_24320 [Agrobacterium vitis]|uniref:hypothetical protein n=1 Tax=Agrobacterium vitis TaxID=373 RepID=UPI0012E92749|nr:hypothetical protein [Agrobacterium vitis]MVA82536.1 hypothetical protein [Agrobacterium vitis]
MSSYHQGLALVIAIAIAALISAIFVLSDKTPSAPSTRLEEPYKRTTDRPPSAVLDENAAPALKAD